MIFSLKNPFQEEVSFLRVKLSAFFGVEIKDFFGGFFLHTGQLRFINCWVVISIYFPIKRLFFNKSNLAMPKITRNDNQRCKSCLTNHWIDIKHLNCQGQND